MASISSLSGSSSSSSSIYGTRNVISGLASGLDTESLIENAVSGYKTKVTSLQKSRTKVEWQQEAYRSIISKLSSFSTKYASYTSSTNLLSPSFFNSAVKVSTNGTYADKVSASGKTNSNIQLLGVKQLATAASYTVSGSSLSADLTTAAESFSLTGETTVGALNGTLTLKYGGTSVELTFDRTEKYTSAEELKSAIEQKLSEANLTVSGTSYKASDKISVSVDSSGAISFAEIGNAGNGVSIKGATGTLGEKLGIDTSDADNLPKSFTVSDPSVLTETGNTADYLAGGKLSITLDGVTKTIEIPNVDTTGKTEAEANDVFIEGLQAAIDKAFGTTASGASKLTVGNAAEDGSIRLQFTSGQVGSTFKVTAADSNVGSALGLGSTGVASYLDTSKTLGDLLGEGTLDGLEVSGTDKNGNNLYKFVLNGVTIGEYSKDTALETIVNAINSNSEAGVSVSYSKATNQFQFTAKETGAAGTIDFGEGLASKLFGGSTTVHGQDAILSMEVNGVRMEDVTRSSNTIEIDGLTMNLKGTFGYVDVKDADGNVTGQQLDTTSEAVTFTTSADADKIVDVIKQMIEDYNAMATEIKKAYSTLPEQKSDGTYYEPLTDEDKEGMSESTIASYEEKAKAGLLFGDSNLSSLYTSLTSAVSAAGLEKIGITLNYSDGLTTLSLNESELRSVLETDPDKVKDVFTRSTEDGASTNGLMQALKTPLEKYGKTTGTKGILVDKAGSTLAPTSLYTNELYKKLCDIDEQIEKWQEKISDQIDYYTEKFTYMEQLISQMNNQSSMLSGLSGGY